VRLCIADLETRCNRESGTYWSIQAERDESEGLRRELAARDAKAQSDVPHTQSRVRLLTVCYTRSGADGLSGRSGSCHSSLPPSDDTV